MKVLIITGGLSSERRISFMSAKEVKKALTENGHKVKLFDLKKGYSQLKNTSKNFDVIFPVIHGEEGEGGDLHKALKKLNIPFVGGDWKAFKKGWYKIPFKKFCDKNKIPTAPWKVLAGHPKGGGVEDQVVKFGFPAVLKSDNGGSSREVVILRSQKDLKKPDVKKLMSSNNKLLIEKFIEGVEVTVAILGDKVLPLLEIVPEKGQWFDYKNKYWGKTKEIPFAPSLSKMTQKLTQQIALNLHKKLNLGHYSRIDFIFSRKELETTLFRSGREFIVKDETPYVLEVNTIPGLTGASLFPKAALASGLNFNQLIEKLIQMALKGV